MVAITGGPCEQAGEQVPDLVPGQGDQFGWCRLAGAFGKCCHDQEGMGEHGQGGPAVPGAPAADLMLVQTAQALAGLEALFNPPSTMHL